MSCFIWGWWNGVHVRSELRGRLVRSFIYIFFNVGPPKESNFLTTFYGLYATNWAILAWISPLLNLYLLRWVAIGLREVCAWYVSWDDWNVLHVPGPLFIAPRFIFKKRLKTSENFSLFGRKFNGKKHKTTFLLGLKWRLTFYRVSGNFKKVSEFCIIPKRWVEKQETDNIELRGHSLIM